MNELIKDIYNTFGIDVAQKGGYKNEMYFRYAVYNKFKHLKNAQIMHHFNITKSGICRMRIRCLDLKDNRDFIEVQKIIDTMDVNLFYEFLDRTIEKKEKPVTRKLMSLNDAILQLRKDPKNKLWNKVFNTWTINDFKTVQKL